MRERDHRPILAPYSKIAAIEETSELSTTRTNRIASFSSITRADELKCMKITNQRVGGQDGRGRRTCHRTSGSSLPGTGSGSGRGRRSRRRPPAARPTPTRRSSSLLPPFRPSPLCPPREVGRGRACAARGGLCPREVKSSATGRGRRDWVLCPATRWGIIRRSIRGLPRDADAKQSFILIN